MTAGNWVAMIPSVVAILISLSSIQICELTKCRQFQELARNCGGDAHLTSHYQAQANKHWRRAWPTRLLPGFRNP